MTMIISGTGLGNFQHQGTDSQGVLSIGQQLQDQLQVNVTNGNLTLQRRDALMLGRLSQHQHLRTYNAQGLMGDEEAFIWGFDQRIVVQSGGINNNNSQVTRLTQDGFEQVFTFQNGRYFSVDGEGAHDHLRFDEARQQWHFQRDGTEATWVYNATGQLIEETFRGETVKTYEYDSNNHLSAIADASGQRTEFVWQNTLLAKVYVQTPDGSKQAMHYFYDNRHRLERVVVDLSPDDADNNTTVHGNIQDEAIFETVYTYWEDSERIKTITDPGGQTLTLHYQLASNNQHVLSQLADSTGYSINFNYDFVQQVTEVITASGATRYTYDDRGNITQIERPDVGGDRALESFIYDADNNLERYANAYGQETEYQYDANGNLTQRKDALGFITDYRYNANNNLLSETRYHQDSPTDTKQDSFWYNTNGDMRFSVSAEGRVTAYDYQDSLLTRARTFKNAFTGNLSLSALTAFSSAETSSIATLNDFTRDWRGMVQSETQYAKVGADGEGIVDEQTQQSTYTYDVHGQVLQKITGRNSTTASTETWGYDGLGRNTFYRNGAGEVQSTTYQDNQREREDLAIDGTVTTTQWDTRGFTLSTQLSPASVKGDLKAQTTQFFYDTQGRLISQTAASGQQTFYFYDAKDRKIGELNTGGQLQTYYYTSGQRLDYSLRHYQAVTIDVQVLGNQLSHSLAELMPVPSEWDRRRDYRYDMLGRLEQESVAGRLQIDYQYDADSSRLTRTTQTDLVLNHVRQNRSLYDEDGLLIAEQDGAGYLTQHHYNGAGQLIHSEQFAQAAGADADLSQVPVRHADDDRSTRYYYNNAGEQVAMLNFQGVLSESQYNAATRTRTDTAYQRFLNLTSTQAETHTLDTLHMLATSSDDEVSVSQFDLAGRLIESTNAQGLHTRYEYNNRGQLIHTVMTDITTNEQRATRQLFDELGRVSVEFNGRGSKLYSDNMDDAEIDALIQQYGMRYQYDSNNRVTQIAAPSPHPLYYPDGQFTRFWYDDDNHRTLTINPDGRMVLTEQNIFGETIKTHAFYRLFPVYNDRFYPADPSQAFASPYDSIFDYVETQYADDRDHITHHRFDTLGNQREHMDGEGYLHTYTHTAFGQLEEQRLQLTKASSDQGERTQVTRFKYDGRSLLLEQALQMDDNSWQITRQRQDAFGQVSYERNAIGQVTTHDYLNKGQRLLSTFHATGLVSEQKYDAQGRVIEQSDNQGKTSTTFAYENFGRLIETVSAEGLTAQAHMNAFGQETFSTDHYESTLEYQYNALGLLETVLRDGEHREYREYNEFGQLTTLTHRPNSDNALIESFRYNADGQVLSQNALSAKEVIENGFTHHLVNTTVTNNYNGLGQVVQQRQSGGLSNNTDFEYDRNGNLVKEVQDVFFMDRQFSRFTLDSQGNILQSILGTQSNNRETIIQENTYHYDKAGNLLEQVSDVNGQALRSTKTYDALGRVLRSESPQSGRQYFFYSSDNLRKAKVDAMGQITLEIANLRGEIQERVTFVERIDTHHVEGFSFEQFVDEHLDALNLSAAQRQFFAYNDDGEVLFRYQNGGVLTHYRHDHNNRIRYEDSYFDIALQDLALGDATIINELKSIIDTRAADITRTNFYDIHGNLSAEVNELGEVTRYQYDDADHVHSRHLFQQRLSLEPGAVPTRDDLSQLATSPNDQREFFFYDALGQQTQQFSVIEQETKDGIEQVRLAYTQRVFDQRGNVSEEQSGELTIELAELNTLENSLENIDRGTLKNLATSYFAYDYDGSDRVMQAEDRLTQATVAYFYDIFDNVVREHDALGTSHYNRYNSQGQLIFTLSNEGRLTEQRYNERGMLVQTIQYSNMIAYPSSTRLNNIENYIAASDSDQHQFYFYNDAGELSLTVDRAGNAWLTSHPDNRTDIVEQKFFDRVFATDSFAIAEASLADMLESLGHFAASHHTRQYFDRNGQLIASIDGEGYLSFHQYNNLGQNTESFVFKERIDLSQLQTADDIRDYVGEEGAVIDHVNRRYNSTGLLLEERVERGEFDEIAIRSYDSAGRVLSETRNGQTLYKTYNAGGQLRFQANHLGFVTEYRYHNDGQQAATIQYALPVDPATLATGRFNESLIANPEQDRFQFTVLNAQGLVAYEYSSDGALSHYEYDKNGQQWSVQTYLNPLDIDSSMLAQVQSFDETLLTPYIDDSENWHEDRRDFFDNDGLVRYRLYSQGLMEQFEYDGNQQIIRTEKSRHNIDLTTFSSRSLSSLEYLLNQANNNDSLIAPDNQVRLEQIIYDDVGQPRFRINASGFLSEQIPINSQTQVTRQYTIKLAENQDNGEPWQFSILKSLTQTHIDYIDTIQISDDNGQARFIIDGDGFILENQFNALGQVILTIAHGRIKLADGDRYGISSNSSALTPSDWQHMDDKRMARYLDEQAAAGQFEPEAIDSISYNFYRFGRLAYAVTGRGAVTEYQYNERQQLETVIRYATLLNPATVSINSNIAAMVQVDAENDQLETHTYDSLGREVTRTNYLGHTNETRYNAFNEVAEQIADSQGDGRTQRFSYNRQGQVVTQETELNSQQTRVEQSTYDTRGQVISITDGEGDNAYQIQNRAGQVVASINGLGEIKRISYNAHGEVVAERHYALRIAPQTINQKLAELGSDDTALNHWLSEIESADDRTVKYGYNALGQIDFKQNQQGYRTYQYYDAFERMDFIDQEIADGRWVRNDYQYDKRGHLTGSVQDAEGLALIRRQSYNAQGLLASDTHALGESRFYYDSDSQLTDTIDESGAVSAQRYDAFGRIITETDGFGNNKTYRYDSEDNSLTMTTSEGITFKTIFNAFGDKLIVIDGEGNKTQYFYNGLGQITRVIDALGQEQSNTYDLRGQLATQTDKQGRLTDVTVDAAGRSVTETLYSKDGQARTTTYTFNAFGERSIKVDHFGEIEERLYFNHGRIVQTTQDKGGRNLITEVHYNGLGQADYQEQWQADSPDQKTLTHFSYDNLGRVVTKIRDPYGLAEETHYRYNALGQVIRQESDFEGLSLAHYTPRGLLEFSRQANGYLIQNIYDANEQLIEERQFLETISESEFEQLIAGAFSPGDFHSTKRFYDQDGRQFAIMDPKGLFSITEHDNNGKVLHQYQLSQADSALLLTYLGQTPEQYQANLVTQALTNASLSQAWDTFKLLKAWHGLNLNNPSTPEIGFDRNQLDIALSKAITVAMSLSDKAGLWLRIRQHTTTVISQTSVLDALGRERFRFDAAGNASEIRYHADNSIQALIQYADANLTRIAATELEHVTAAVNANTAWNDQTSQKYYNDFNELRFEVNQDRVTEYQYDSVSGQIARIIEYANRLGMVNSFAPVDINVDTLPSLLARSDDDRHQQMHYNDKRQLVYKVDATGQVQKRSYNHQGLLESTQTFSVQVSSHATWTIAELATLTATDAAQQQTATIFDALGRIRFERDALGYINEYHYQDLPDGTWTKTTYRHYEPMAAIDTFLDDNARTAWFNAILDKIDERFRPFYWLGLRQQTETFNGAGERIKVSSALNTSETFVYNHRGQLIQHTNKNGHTEYAYYDDSGNRVATFSPTEIRYDAALIDFEAVDFGVADANRGYLKTFIHDQMGRVIEERFYRDTQSISDIDVPNGDYDRKTFTYDKTGLVSATHVYDADNTLLQLEEFRYNAFGEIVSSIQGGSSAARSETQYTYDQHGHLIEQHEAFGTSDAAVTRYEYNDFDQNSKVTNPLGIEVAYQDSDWARDQREFLGYPRNLTDLSATQQQALRDLYSMEQTFDANNQKISQTNGLGESTETRFDAFGNIVHSLHPDGRQEFFFYNAANQLILVIDSFGRGLEKRYDNMGNVTHEIRYGSRISDLDKLTPAADAQALLTELKAGPTQEKQFEYDQLGRKIRERDAAGNWTHFSYDAMGQLVKTTNAKGVETFLLYDGQGRKRAEQVNDHLSATALITRYGYDAFNRTTSVEKAYRPEAMENSDGGPGDIENSNPLDFNRVESLRYNALGQVIETINTQGQTTAFSYDLRGNLITETNSYGGVKQHYYNDLNQRIATVDEENYLSVFEYDKAGNQIKARSFETAITTLPSDHYRSPSAISGDRFREVHLIFDTQNRQVKSTAASDWQIIDGEHFSKRAVTTERIYDTQGNVLSETDGRGNTTHHYYDLLGNRIFTINPEGEIKQFKYDDFDRLIQEISIDRHYTTRLVIDIPTLPIDTFGSHSGNPLNVGGVNSSLTSDALIDGLVIPYNSAQRPSQQALEDFIAPLDSSQFIIKGYTYDAMNRLTYVVVMNTAISFFNDDSGPVFDDFPIETNISTFSSASSTSSADDDTVQTVTANHITKITYDGLGQLTKKEVYGFRNIFGKQGATYTTDYEYDQFGRLSAEISPEFIGFNQDALRQRQAMTYNALGQLESYQEGGNSKAQNKIHENGQLKSEQGYQGKKSYGYDDNGNLEWVFIDSLGRRESYTYNKKGEVISTSIYDQASLAHSATLLEEQSTRYNAFGQVLAQGINGNWHSYNRYDQLGRLSSSNANGGVAEVYFYDLNGNRTAVIKSDSIDLSELSPDEILNLQPRALEDQKIYLSYARYDKNNRSIASGDVNVDVWRSRATNWERRVSNILANTISLDLRETKANYNALGFLETQEDALGNVTTYFYDKLGNRLRTELAEVDVWHENGYREANATPVRSYAYNVLGELIKETDANENSTRYRYALGQRSEIIFADNTKRRQEYDQYGELRSTEEAGGQYRKTFYWFFNDRGEKTTLHSSTIDPEVDYADASTYWEVTKYNISNKVIEHSREEDLSFGWSYATEKSNNIHRYNYDALGRLKSLQHITQIQDDNNGTVTRHLAQESYQYDAFSAQALALNNNQGGTIITKYDFRNNTLVEHFDHFQKMLFQEDYWNHHFTWTYNKAGQLVSVTSLNPEPSLSLYSADSTTNNVGFNLNESAANDLNNQPSSADSLLLPIDEDTLPGLPGGETNPNLPVYTNKNVTYRYDGYGNLQEIKDHAHSRTSTYGYNKSGLRNYERHSYGTTTHQVVNTLYDSHNRITSIEGLNSSGAANFQIGFAYDAAGNVRRKSVTTPALAGISRNSENYWYTYDERNRMLISQGKVGQFITVDIDIGFNGIILKGTKFEEGYATSQSSTQYKVHQESGYKISYDDTGRRASFSSTTQYVRFEHSQPGQWTNRQVIRRTEHYQYDDNGHLETIGLSSSGNIIYARENDHWGRAFHEVEYDLETGDKFKTSWSKLNQFGQTAILRFADHNNNGDQYTTTRYAYYNDGALDYSETAHWGRDDDDLELRFYAYQAYGDSYKQSHITARREDPDDGDPSSNYRSKVDFDSNGNEIRAYAYNQGSDAKKIDYYRDAEGRVLYRRTTPYLSNENEFDFKHYYFYFNGQAIGRIGNDGSADGTFSAGLEQRINAKNNPPDPYAEKPSYDFEANTHFFTGRANAQFYRAQGGESLSTLAQSFMGDASLWYVIADANGLSYDAILSSGQQIQIPASFQGQQHNSTTFKPFSASETLRDFSPTLPAAGDNCRVIKIVVFIAVTIAVSIATSGAASAFFAGMSNAVLAGVLSGVTGALAANAANQGIGMAMGMQAGWNWGALAKESIVGGLTGGIGGAYKQAADAGKKLTWAQTASKALLTSVVSASADLIQTALTEDDLSGRDFAMAGLSIGLSVGSAMLGNVADQKEMTNAEGKVMTVDRYIGGMRQYAQGNGTQNFFKYATVNALYKSAQATAQHAISNNIYNALTNDPDEKRKFSWSTIAATAAKSAAKSLYATAVSMATDPVMEDLSSGMTKTVWQKTEFEQAEKGASDLKEALTIVASYSDLDKSKFKQRFDIARYEKALTTIANALPDDASVQDALALGTVEADSNIEAAQSRQDYSKAQHAWAEGVTQLDESSSAIAIAKELDERKAALLQTFSSLSKRRIVQQLGITRDPQTGQESFQPKTTKNGKLLFIYTASNPEQRSGQVWSIVQSTRIKHDENNQPIKEDFLDFETLQLTDHEWFYAPRTDTEIFIDRTKVESPVYYARGEYFDTIASTWQKDEINSVNVDGTWYRFDQSNAEYQYHYQRARAHANTVEGYTQENYERLEMAAQKLGKLQTVMEVSQEVFLTFAPGGAAATALASAPETIAAIRDGDYLAAANLVKTVLPGGNFARRLDMTVSAAIAVDEAARGNFRGALTNGLAVAGGLKSNLTPPNKTLNQQMGRQQGSGSSASEAKGLSFSSVAAATQRAKTRSVAIGEKITNGLQQASEKLQERIGRRLYRHMIKKDPGQVNSHRLTPETVLSLLAPRVPAGASANGKASKGLSTNTFAPAPSTPRAGEIGHVAPFDKQAPAEYDGRGSKNRGQGNKLTESEHAIPHGVLKEITRRPDTKVPDYTPSHYRKDSTYRSEYNTALNKTHRNRGGESVDNEATKRLQRTVSNGGGIDVNREVMLRQENALRANRDTHSVVPETSVNQALLEQLGNLFDLQSLAESGRIFKDLFGDGD